MVLGLLVVLGLGVSFPRGNTVVQQVADKLGAVSGPDSFFNCETHNGVQTCFVKQSFRQATSTPVDIVSPTATSTLTHASCSYRGTAGASVVARIFKGATFHATTTILAQRTLPTGAMDYPLVASTTPPVAAETTLMFPPSNHLVMDIFGAVGLSLTGSCSAEFKTI